jgi:hypothetical protein
VYKSSFKVPRRGDEMVVQLKVIGLEFLVGKMEAQFRWGISRTIAVRNWTTFLARPSPKACLCRESTPEEVRRSCLHKAYCLPLVASDKVYCSSVTSPFQALLLRLTQLGQW